MCYVFICCVLYVYGICGIYVIEVLVSWLFLLLHGTGIIFRRISLLISSLLRFVDSTFPGTQQTPSNDSADQLIHSVVSKVQAAASTGKFVRQEDMLREACSLSIYSYVYIYI